MRFQNRTQRIVFLSMFEHDDARYQFNLMLPVPLQWVKLRPGEEAPGFNHPKRDYFRIGIAEPGKVDPNVPGDLLHWTDLLFFNSSNLALTETGGNFKIIDAVVPVPDADPRRLDQNKLNATAQPMPGYTGLHFGIGKAFVTDAAGHHPMSGLGMQGWSIARQKSQSIERDNDLYARAFVIDNPGQAPGFPQLERLVMVVCDIWSCSIAIKAEVVRRLRMDAERPSFTHGNVWIAGTHTHSGPGGFLHHTLYNATVGGFDVHVFECIVRGIIVAIEDAVMNMGPGSISVIKADLPGLGRNRSRASYDRNPPAERVREDKFDGTDPEFLLLRFKSGVPGKEVPAGALSWFGLHTTCRGQGNTAINGDHKGFAAQLFEQHMVQSGTTKRFIAAFANAHSGDVSGNFVPGSDPRKFDPPKSSDPVAMGAHKKRMEAAGRAQFEAANKLFASTAGTSVLGPLDWHHRFIDMAAGTGTIAALGASFAAGSTEDGDSEVELSKSPGDKAEEGIFLVRPGDFFTVNKANFGSFLNALSSSLGIAWDTYWSLVRNFAALDFKAVFDTVLHGDVAHRNAHFPKPILLMPGNFSALNVVPSIIPIQILKLGPLAVTGVPAEITTIAGTRLKRTIQTALRGSEFVAIGSYVNGYASYITTAQEYAGQDYEGASNLFGPLSFGFMRGEFEQLALEMAKGLKGPERTAAPDLTSFVAAWTSKRRLTFRNLSPDIVTFWVFGPNETNLTESTALRFPVPPNSTTNSFMVASGQEVAVNFADVLGLTDRDVQIVFAPVSGAKGVPPGAQQLYCWCRSLVVVDHKGQGHATSNYVAAQRRV